MNLAVPCRGAVVCMVTAPLVHRCPFRDEADEGHIELTWATAGSTLELHALHAWLASFHSDVISHEDLTADIAEHLAELPGIDDVQVTTRWTTAGVEVVVRRAVPRERLIGAGA
jgi:NADPH-dependent 7-cyano-7-deazaguanine reductase QueF